MPTCSASTPAAPARSIATRGPPPRPPGAPWARRPAAPITARSVGAWIGPMSGSTDERFKERFHFRGERLGLLEGGEVAALFHDTPAPNIAVGLLRQRARRAQDFLREVGIADRHVDRPSARNRPAIVHAR